MERIGKLSEGVAYRILLSLCKNDSNLRMRATNLIDKYEATLATHSEQQCSPGAGPGRGR